MTKTPMIVPCEEIDNFADLKEHEWCSMFPDASEDDYDNLVISMKNRGFLDDQPIVVYEENDEYRILDGRNRRNAALDAGVIPSFVEFMGDDPLGYVIARNLNRRHLTAGQKAALAAKLATLRQGDGTKEIEEGGITQEEASKLVNSNKTNIAKYKKVLAEDPELAEKVGMGEVSLDKAYNSVRDIEPGGGTGQRPSEALPASPSAPDGGIAMDIPTPSLEADDGPPGASGTASETGIPASLRPDPDEKLGSLNMDFEKAPMVERKISASIDRGPWDSGNFARDEFERKHPIKLVGLGPSVHRLSRDEALAIVRSLNMAVDKVSDD